MIQYRLIRQIVVKEMKERLVRHVVVVITLPILSGLFFVPHFWGADQNFNEVIKSLLPLYQRMLPLIEEQLLHFIIYTDIYLPVFILVPAFTSPFLGVLEGIINEKQNRTLEHLLSLPVSDHEILLGKMSGGIFSGITVTWVIYIVYLIFYWLKLPEYVFQHLLSPKWLMLTFVLAPLLSFKLNSIGIILAIWLKNLNAAAYLGILILSPLFFSVFSITFGMVILDPELIIFSSIFFMVAGMTCFAIAVNLFNRERLLLRYP